MEGSPFRFLWGRCPQFGYPTPSAAVQGRFLKPCPDTVILSVWFLVSGFCFRQTPWSRQCGIPRLAKAARRGAPVGWVVATSKPTSQAAAADESVCPTRVGGQQIPRRFASRNDRWEGVVAVHARARKLAAGGSPLNPRRSTQRPPLAKAARSGAPRLSVGWWRRPKQHQRLRRRTRVSSPHQLSRLRETADSSALRFSE